MKLEDIELRFNCRDGEKRWLKLKINGQEINAVKDLTLNIPVDGVPTLSLEMYINSLNIPPKEEHTEDIDVITKGMIEKKTITVRKESRNMKFRKKPVEIEAFQYDGDFMDKTGKYDIPDWAVKAIDTGVLSISDDAEGTIAVKTLEGVMTAHIGDYIIQGVNGELYPCRADIFVKTYDIVYDRDIDV